jgi:hypothetical protein
MTEKARKNARRAADLLGDRGRSSDDLCSTDLMFGAVLRRLLARPLGCS